MKFKKTYLYAAFVFIVLALVYVFDYRHEEKADQQKDQDLQIVKFDKEQINMLEIIKKDEKILLQKNENGWALLEPIQDKADSDQIEQLIGSIVDEKMLAVAKESDHLTENDLNEYGLDQPLAVYNIKNNLGQSVKITIGTQKNFEGNSFLRIDSENRVYVANAVWFTKAENKLIYYREKKLYRQPLADVTDVKIHSLNDQFELKRNANVWTSNAYETVLDQNKVRETIRKISEATIQDYVFDGEPSEALIEEKKLNHKPIVYIEFATASGTWSVNININADDNSVYALTDRPTRLVKLEPSSWEFFGNLSLDSLRDRVSVTHFNLDNVQKMFIKFKGQELNFVRNSDEKWKREGQNKIDDKESDEITSSLNRIHDLEISEFIDKRQADHFKGTDMIILKTEDGNLVYQLNWGPEFKMKKAGKEKDYYYARTQISSSIFAIEKERIDAIGLEKIFKTKEIK
jgi:hypothetical protein